ncbi:hypothetical protein ACS5PN_13525 [Roseateles sp. NT4]|uniref:hypothetical protein n=1 Tax=Roseateles sp. NT4 TaxID=3453715 RepID=UPI003EE82716
MRNAAALVASALLLTACTRADPGISDRLSALVDSGAAAIDMALLGPADWQKVCVLQPYTSNERAEQILGFKWDAASKSSIGTNDGIHLLVFVKGSDVVAYAEHPRSKGDFLKLSPHCLSRSHAHLLRQIGPDGRVQLVLE